MVCSGRFAGDRHTCPALPPSSHRERGSPRWRWRPCWPPAAAVLLGREPAGRHLQGQGGQRRASRPTSASARPRCCSSASATPARRRSPRSTVTVSIAGKAGQTSSLPFGDPRPPARPRPARPPGLGPGRSTIRNSPAPRAPGGATTSNQKTFDFGPLKPRRDDRSGLEAERGQEPATTPSSTGSTPASAAAAKAKTAAASRRAAPSSVEISDAPAEHRSHRQRRNRRMPSSSDRRTARLANRESGRAAL